MKSLTALAVVAIAMGSQVSADQEVETRVDPSELDRITAVGSSTSLWSEEDVGGEGVQVTSPAPSGGKPQCPPILYTFGKFREVIFECDGAGGTEFAPWFESAELDESESGEEPRREVISISREDVQSLLVHSGTVIVQPDQPWVLVNTDTVVMTDATEHVLSTQVLGLDVDVRVSPALYTWDFGDGSPPLTTTDPGRAWPDHTVSHVYRAPTTAAISLRTEWDAVFRVEGTDVWVPVTGRAVTTAATDPIDVVTATPRLTSG